MTDQPSAPAGTHGAVDLTAIADLTTPTTATAGSGPRPGGRPAPALPQGLLVEATDATFQDAVTTSMRAPAVLVLWSSQHPQTADFVASMAQAAAGFDGRVFVVAVDLATNPALLQAFQPLLVQAFGQPAIPSCFALLQGQPMPLFPGVAPEAELKGIIEQMLQVAVQNGITGRIELGPVPGAEDGEDEVPPLHQAAFDAIERGDLQAAEAAYAEALAADPRDTDAALGLGQVRLLRRTQDLDGPALRARAAADPDDIEAAVQVADLDLVGGHVDDAFGRLLDLVRRTSGDERDRARTHLIGLFEVVGNQDERVRTARTALMSALF